ncbi:latexin [Pyxicephalus adspersus]|uniref:Cystatin LXN-type domain-containing protein n=1 Tax=Pyxicephalus adspersus TaxID=30357 RepID=A0AAV3AEL1_PYXAD|nr:TPA: hypothetical protein GDO54_010423 [Pyxicephalus adspersus]
METIPPSNFPATRAAGVAVDCMNYKMGTPNRLFQRQQVTSARKEIIAGVGNKYHLAFSIKDSINEQPEIPCTVEVLYYSDKNNTPDVKYNLKTTPENYTAAKDQDFYSRMMNNKKPLIAEDIPDKFGAVTPEMEPVWNLAIAAAGLAKWKNATEETLFAMTIIKKVEQLITSNALELNYDLLIHDMVSQEVIPWRIEVKWDPSGGLKVKNHKRLPKQNADHK